METERSASARAETSGPKRALYIVCGLPGAGKSAHVNRTAPELGAQVVCPEDMRRALGHRYFGPVEPLVHAISMAQVRAHMLRGIADVMLDETGVRASHVRKWKGVAEAHGYRARLVFLDTPPEVCRARRCADPSYPPHLIDAALARLETDREAIFAMVAPEDREVIVWSGESGSENAKRGASESNATWTFA